MLVTDRSVIPQALRKKHAGCYEDISINLAINSLTVHPDRRDFKNYFMKVMA
jgi:hypothetical protein